MLQARYGGSIYQFLLWLDIWAIGGKLSWYTHLQLPYVALRFDASLRRFYREYMLTFYVSDLVAVPLPESKFFLVWMQVLKTSLAGQLRATFLDPQKCMSDKDYKWRRNFSSTENKLLSQLMAAHRIQRIGINAVSSRGRYQT